NDAATRFYFRPAAENSWQEVTVPAASRNGVRFPVNVSGPIVVRVMVSDLVGNTGEGAKEIPAVSLPTMTTSLSPTIPPPTDIAHIDRRLDRADRTGDRNQPCPGDQCSALRFELSSRAARLLGDQPGRSVGDARRRQIVGVVEPARRPRIAGEGEPRHRLEPA